MRHEAIRCPRRSIASGHAPNPVPSPRRSERDGNSGNDLHIRDTGSEFADFYSDLVTKYLPNLVTQYVPGVSGQVDYFPGGDTSKALATAKKLQVPYLLEYDRSRSVGGQPAPIAQQWIHANGDGTYKEYMTEWWYVNDLPGRYADRPDPAGLAAQLAFADEAIAALGTFFEALPCHPEVVATAPVAPDAPVATVAGTAVTVSWTAPSDGGSPITEYLVSLNGGAPVSVPAGTTTRTFTGLASGEYTATVAARNAAGTSAASAASAAVTVVAPPAVDPTTVKGAVAVASAGSGTAFVDVLGWLALALLAAGGAVYAVVRVRARHAK
ncbi:hypothetical protein ASE14_08980 [Agromyces sp. Root81]|uniref:fibronectin type III domain-containing protein n=1 Tax=Agromyces sp. Root81 TaxID=1736601 RepID=UPI0007021D64|nr:fibronectin type III domain-containing protein [Agromyces sp. Root81]KRC61069.1 hypothetical protein ASE14_08980 [Agromyces sp. Root81]